MDSSISFDTTHLEWSIIHITELQEMVSKLRCILVHEDWFISNEEVQTLMKYRITQFTNEAAGAYPRHFGTIRTQEGGLGVLTQWA